MSTVEPEGARTRASYVIRIPGESCSGIHVRVKIDSPCVKRNGAARSAVWSGSSHWSASERAVVR